MVERREKAEGMRMGREKKTVVVLR